MRNNWMLLDGSSLVFRAFYGVPRTMRSPAGMPVNAIRGFTDNLARLLTDHRPTHVLVATDVDWRPAWRVDLVPSYKSHRTAEPIPPELDPQFPIAWDLMAAVGIAVAGAPDHEAEDVIATAAARVTDPVTIVSGDRDLFALVRDDPPVRVLYPEKGGMASVDEAELARRYGVPGNRYLDFAVLRGDPSDGLPGLAGVGAKRAADMVLRHPDFPSLLASPGLSAADRDYLARARRVVQPVNDIVMEIPDCVVPPEPRDPVRMRALAEEFGLGGSVDRLARALEVAGSRPA